LGLLPVFKTVTFDEPKSVAPSGSNSQLLREQLESKDWYDLAQEIVRHSESRGEGSREKVNIPLPLLQQNNGLMDLEIDEDKIAEIKDALNQYQKLKQEEDEKVN